MATILITALCTLIVTVLAQLLLDRVRRGSPQIRYHYTQSTPFDIQDMKYGAYRIDVWNPSSHTIKDVTISVEAESTNLRNGGLEITRGLDYAEKNTGKTLSYSIPFMKANDEFSVTVIAESKHFIPKEPSISIRSPERFKLIDERQRMESSNVNKWLSGIAIGMIPAVAVFIVLYFQSKQLDISALADAPSSSGILTVAARSAGLKDLVERYAVAGNVHYYAQGPLAYSMALVTKDKEEVKKYELFLVTVLRGVSDQQMARTSRCALLFYLAKIQLLLGKDADAKENMTRAQDLDSKHYQFLFTTDK